MTLRPRLLSIALVLVAAPLGAQASPATSPTPVVDSLLSRGLIQEAAWAARAAGDAATADSLVAVLDSILRSPPLDARPMSMESQGVSYTMRLQHEGGIGAVFKVDGSDIFCPSCGADREVAAYRIDRLLGLELTPVTVFQTIVVEGDTLRGSSQYLVRGATRPAEAGREKPDLLRFFDAVLGNSDRHGGNWLEAPGGAIVAIDHNRAFEYRPTTRPKTCWETEVDSIRGPRALGAPFERYRTLPPDSLAAAVADLRDPALAERFVAMRERVVERIERRIRRPLRAQPLADCLWER